MMLPKKVGSFTLMRKLDADGITESFVAILDDPPGKQVVARRIVPSLASDPARMARIIARVQELEPIRHPCLAAVLGLVHAEGEPYVLEEWTDGMPLRGLIDACQKGSLSPPANVYLHLATQLCNALEALHTAREGQPLLHLGLSPSSIVVGADGRVTVARYGLVPAPLTGSDEGDVRVAYLAPEQTHPDPTLDPAADIFALGVVLYELSTLEPLFEGSSPERTIEQIRRAEITLTDVRERVPGLDQVLQRALSVHPRHRYQRAFVVREDLRGLMAGYTFTEIDRMAREFLAPLVRGRRDRGSVDELVPPPDLPPGGPADMFSDDADTHVDPRPLLDQQPTVLQTELAETPLSGPELMASYGRRPTASWIDHEATTVLQQGRAHPPTFPMRSAGARSRALSIPPPTWAPFAAAGAAVAAVLLMFMCAGFATTSLIVWSGQPT